MRRLLFISLILLGLLTSIIFLSPVKAINGWSTPTQLTNNTTTDSNPSISGDGSKITFSSNLDGDSEIFVVNSDGSGLTQLTSNTANDYNPSISRDGSKITFHSNLDGDFEIFVVNSDGTGLTQLTSNTATDYGSSISGDGSKIAFYSNVDGDYEIFVSARADPSSPTMYYVVVGVLVPVVLIGAVIFYLKKKKRPPPPVIPIKTVKPPTPPTPTQLRLSADPLTIVADDTSKSTLTLQLLDREDKPACATTDVEVKLFASKGKLAKPTITLLKGTSSAKTFITASREQGSVLVSASVEGLRSGEVALNFKEEALHCLYCGSITTSLYEPCPKCGRIPP